MSARNVTAIRKIAPENFEIVLARENAGWVREFLASVRPLKGCCFCGNDSFSAGRAAVERIALALERADESLLPSADECVDVLVWLTGVEPVDAANYCHGCSGKGGYTVVLHIVSDILGEALGCRGKAQP